MIHTKGNLTGTPEGEYAIIDKSLFISSDGRLRPVAASGLIGALVRQYGNPRGTIKEREQIAARIAEEIEKRG